MWVGILTSARGLEEVTEIPRAIRDGKRDKYSEIKNGGNHMLTKS